MKKLLLLGVIALSSFTYSQEFQRLYGDSLSDIPRDIITTSSSDLLVVGQSTDATYTLNGTITKIDTTGNVLWSKSYGDPNKDDFLASIIEDNGFYYAVGMTRSFSVDTTMDVFVVKTDLNGSVIWMRSFGATGESGGYEGDWANTIVKESTNTFLLAGTWAGVEAAQLRGGYLLRIDDTGNLLNQYIVDGSGSEAFGNIALAQNTDILLCGFNKVGSSWEPWYYRMTSSGALVANSGFGNAAASNNYGRGILEYNNETFFLAGKGDETMLCKLNNLGDTLGVILYGDSLAGTTQGDIILSQDNNLFLLSEFNQKGMVAKLDLNGDTLWVNYIANNIGNFSKLVELNGYLYILGSTVSNTNGSDDIYIVKIKNDGTSNLCITEDHSTFYYYHGSCTVTPFAEAILIAGFNSTVNADTNSIQLNKCEICILPDFTYTVNDQTVQFSNSTNVDVNYTWDFGDGNSSTNESPTYTYSSYGTFTVCLTSSDACSGDSVCQVIDIIDYTGLDELDNAIILIYPNPNNGVFNIVSFEGNKSISVLDATGRSVMMIMDENKNTSVDLSSYSKGIYFIEVSNDSLRTREKIIVQ